MGMDRNFLAQLLSRATSTVGSGVIPSDIIRASLTVSSARKGGVGLGRSFGKKADDLVIEVQEAFCQRKADGGRGEALAGGVERMFEIRRVGIPPAFGDDLAVPEEHEAVKFGFAVSGGIDELADGGSRDAFFFGNASGERVLGESGCIQESSSR
jgi:hypothetical protein